MQIRLECLGGLRVLASGRELLELQQHRARLALLAHLAVERRVRRDAVLAVFWPESDGGNARHALRQALYRLRQSIGDDGWLRVEGEELFATERLSCDVLDFETAADGGDRPAAANLYRGPFLDAIHLVDSHPWERWVDGQRARLTRLYRLTCRAWVDERLAADDLEGALAAAHAWVRPDPMEDEAQHRLIELLALAGDRTGAVRQFESYARLLEADGLTPLDETLEIVRSLRAPAADGPDAALPSTPPQPAENLTAAAGATSATTAPADPHAGAELNEVAGWHRGLAGEFELIRQLGEGSVARVFLARERELRRLVAVKVLREELAADRSIRDRFEREARAAASIRHPGVLGIHRVGRSPDGVPYIVMEYVDGRTLADLVAARGTLGVEEVRRILLALAGSLAAAHRMGIVHRDVRPANVLWEADTDRIVLADFGLAALLDSAVFDTRRLTRQGERLGDPTNMSPEQVRGETVTPQTDIYSLGVVAHELLTGRGPFVGTTQAVLKGHVAQNPPPLREARPDTDPQLDDLVRRCLTKAPERRPRAAELHDELLRATGPHGAETAAKRGGTGTAPVAGVPPIASGSPDGAVVPSTPEGPTETPSAPSTRRLAGVLPLLLILAFTFAVAVAIAVWLTRTA